MARRIDHLGLNRAACEAIARATGLPVVLGDRAGRTPWCHLVEVRVDDVVLRGDIYRIQKGRGAGGFSIKIGRPGKVFDLLVDGSPAELAEYVSALAAAIREGR